MGRGARMVAARTALTALTALTAVAAVAAVAGLPAGGTALASKDATAAPAAAAASAILPPAALVAPTPTCSDAATQLAMNQCAYDDFLAASAALAAQVRALRVSVPAVQRERLRRMQTAWTAWRTAACRFEAGPVAGGSLHDFIYWSCAARMTRERGAQVAASADCVEGDVTCTPRGR